MNGTTNHLADSGFGKIFQTTYTGSLIGSGPVVMSVWPFVIANTKPPGVVELVPRYIAAVIGCKAEDVVDAIEFLSREDPESRSPEDNGRRLVHMDGHLYRVPTWETYRLKRDDEERKAYFRRKKQEQRAKERLSKTVKDSPRKSHLSTQAEAEAEAEAESELSLSPVVRTTEKNGNHLASESLTNGRASAVEAAAQKIRDLRPKEWNKPKTFSAMELHALHDAMPVIAELSDDDLSLIARYLKADLEQGAGFWQPRQRLRCIETLGDVYGHAKRWEQKLGRVTKTDKSKWK